MKNTILFCNQPLKRFTSEIFAKILQNILRIFFVAKNRNFYMHWVVYIPYLDVVYSQHSISALPKVFIPPLSVFCQ